MNFRTSIAAIAASVAALAIAAPAVATTGLNFSASANEPDFLFPLAATIDFRDIQFSGSVTFGSDFVNGTAGIGDITNFTLNMRRRLHFVGAPAGIFATADYAYSAADLSAFSLTFLGGAPIAGSWTLDLISPYAFSNANFAPLTGLVLDSSQDPSLTYYQLFQGKPLAIAQSDFDRVSVIGAGAVPEPASWAMMIAGFGLSGAAIRRRRKTAALAAA